MSKVFVGLLVSVVFKRIRPEEIAHGSKWWRLLEPVQLSYIVQSVYLGREAAMNAQELLVHERRQRQAIERLHACIVNAFRVFDFAFLFEREVLS